ncbi:CinA family protein [Gulosibacter sp. ACHW.36C]|uniref:CinA family protein n=1 Tax=Gulosibacter sediminis TaxID=1729695 RepID=A0ABY4N0A4_9MICO|nr:nicotinamide-nucleotide amidohydrolase family protein [Gulosibacter sediminis]UQN16127.1 CinA family protein [Gulosibacter sediminis]
MPAQTAELGRVLIEAGLTIAVAESLTGGELAAELVRVPGISASFQGGTVAYKFAAKRELLGVERSLLAAAGAVHPEVAQQMAAGVRRQFSFKGERAVDIGISTTGVAGPDPAADGQQPGTVFVGIDSIFGDRVVQLDFSNLVRDDDPVGSRHRIRIATVEAAIFNLLEHLAEAPRR